MRLLVVFTVSLVIALSEGALLPTASRADVPEYTIIIKDHRFEPAEVKIPAHTKVRLVVRNQDPTPEEFESYDFNREKVVAGRSTIKLFVGPLKPGTYGFFGEFNAGTAQGLLVVE
jgi:hypothetical protein